MTTGPAGIDFGIDLGTSASAIARRRGFGAEVIRNNEGRTTTPSAVWVDRRGQVHVGRKAADRRETDPDNTCLEFKPHLGTDGPVKRLAGVGMSATLLSAHVLRSLRVDVGQRLGEPPAAAVIAVPAGFGPKARDATRRAALLAGFQRAPLLPEPVAAAQALAPRTVSDDETWLVYDLGGGFAAALLKPLGGRFAVLRHTRDRRLGGTAVDRHLVEDLLIPAAVREHPGLTGLARGEPRWSTAIAALTTAAEHAKIRLSRHERAELAVELIDDRHRRHEFRHTLSRADLERITEPILTRSIALCREILCDTDLTGLLLVGGQAALPHLPDRLTEALGVRPTTDADPRTTVARGAAISATVLERSAAGTLPGDPAYRRSR